VSAWIVHRPDRRLPWLARFGPRGSRAVSKSFERQGDAKTWLAEQVTNQARGEFIDPRGSKLTVSQWAEVWSRGRRVAASTRARDGSIINSLILPYFGKRPLGKVTSAHLRAWIADLVETGKAPATIAKAYQLLGAMLELAVRDGRLVRSPARHVELPGVSRTEMQFLEAGQVAALAGAIDPRYRVLVLTAAYTGMRFGELAGLKVDALDLLRGRLVVSRSVNEVRGRLVIGETKTPAGRRTVALPRFLGEALAAHLAGVKDPDGWVFPAPEGGPLRRNGFRSRFWLPAVKAASLPGLRFHDLRHTHAAFLIGAGEHPKMIQTRMGHSSIKTTLDTYGHLFAGLDQAAAERLDQLGSAAAAVTLASVSDISRTAART